MYGTHDTWGGSLAKKAKQIKEVDFAKKVKHCPRLDRALVYQRNGAMSSVGKVGSSVGYPDIRHNHFVDRNNQL